MRRSKGLGLGVLSFTFCAFLIGACSASGNGNGGSDGESGDSGASTTVADSGSKSYGDASSSTTDSGTGSKDAGKPTGIDSGSSTPIDSGSTGTSTADCDLSGSGGFLYFAEASSSTEACGTGDTCSSGECCVNFASFFSGGGSLPPGFSSASPSMCVAQ